MRQVELDLISIIGKFMGNLKEHDAYLRIWSAYCRLNTGFSTGFLVAWKYRRRMWQTGWFIWEPWYAYTYAVTHIRTRDTYTYAVTHSDISLISAILCLVFHWLSRLYKLSALLPPLLPAEGDKSTSRRVTRRNERGGDNYSAVYRGTQRYI